MLPVCCVLSFWLYSDTQMLLPPLSLLFLSPYISQINLRTGTCGTKASLMTVIKKLVCPSLKRFFVLVSLWTTTITPFVRTFYPDMPRGVALQGGSSTTPQLRLPKTGAWRPCWTSVPTQRRDTVDSKPPRNSGNTLHNWATTWGSPQWNSFATLAETLLQRHIEKRSFGLVC